MNGLKGKEFNLRLGFDENGEPYIGFCHGFYQAGSNCIDLKQTPDSIVLQIARKLHIEKSSKSLKFHRQMTRQAAKAKRQEAKQNTFLFENQGVGQ